MAQTFSLKIVVAYENFVAAVRAKRMIERLAARLTPEFAIDLDLWRFDVLRYRELQECAVTAASKADLIVVSAGGTRALPLHVKTWIQSWLPSKRGGGQAALVALLDQDPAGTAKPPSISAALRRIAERWQLDFFCHTAEGSDAQAACAPEAVFLEGQAGSREADPIMESDMADWGRMQAKIQPRTRRTDANQYI